MTAEGQPLEPLPPLASVTSPPPEAEAIAPPEEAAIGEEPGDRLDLIQDRDRLLQEIADLQAQRQALQGGIEAMVQAGLTELQQRRQGLQTEIEQLERRQERIRQEMRTTFAGMSQDLAIRVQGFKDYLVGSLQDLVAAAEQLDFPNTEAPSPAPAAAPNPSSKAEPAPAPQFAAQRFQDQRQRIRQSLEQYRTRPDYYGPPWQLRRTFEPIHAERVQDWFFKQGGRGALRSMGSRLQNILIASAAMAILYQFYGPRLRTLVLANSPERLGEWRRGLQDCLGISRSDFGPDRGVVLFEAADALVQKAERLEEQDLIPLVILDEADSEVSIALLQFPLWLAFAPDPQTSNNYYF